MNLCKTASGLIPEASSPPCSCGPAPQRGFPLAIASVPTQPWETPYEKSHALKQGTIFPCLDLPFYLTEGGSPHV